MANRKKECYKPGPLTEGKQNIIHGLLQEYNIENATDVQEALKDLLGGTLKAMMEAEMDEHLGYAKSERSDSDDARNGYKRIMTSYRRLNIQRSVFPSDTALLKALYLATFKQRRSGRCQFATAGGKFMVSWRSCTKVGCRTDTRIRQICQG